LCRRGEYWEGRPSSYCQEIEALNKLVPQKEYMVFIFQVAIGVMLGLLLFQLLALKTGTGAQNLPLFLFLTLLVAVVGEFDLEGFLAILGAFALVFIVSIATGTSLATGLFLLPVVPIFLLIKMVGLISRGSRLIFALLFYSFICDVVGLIFLIFLKSVGVQLEVLWSENYPYWLDSIAVVIGAVITYWVLIRKRPTVLKGSATNATGNS